MECAKIARFLHDDVGQTLSAVGLQLELMRLDFGETVPTISARTLEIQQLLESAMVQLRGLIGQLNQGTGEPGGAGQQSGQ